MMAINDGGPAFPPNAGWRDNDPQCRGMSLRDWFAGQALNYAYNRAEDVMKTADDCDFSDVAELAAAWAYSIADAMIEERKAGA